MENSIQPFRAISAMELTFLPRHSVGARAIGALGFGVNYTVWIAGMGCRFLEDGSNIQWISNEWLVYISSKAAKDDHLGSHLNTVWGLLLVMLALEIWWHGWHVRVTVTPLLSDHWVGGHQHPKTAIPGICRAKNLTKNHTHADLMSFHPCLLCVLTPLVN